MDLRYNRLATFPEALDTRKAVIVNASRNYIAHWPQSATFEQAAVLDLSYNDLEEVPDTISSARKLQQLYLCNNKLLLLPEIVRKAPLVDLFLADNLFTCALALVPRPCLLHTNHGNAESTPRPAETCQRP